MHLWPRLQKGERRPRARSPALDPELDVCLTSLTGAVSCAASPARSQAERANVLLIKRGLARWVVAAERQRFEQRKQHIKERLWRKVEGWLAEFPSMCDPVYLLEEAK